MSQHQQKYLLLIHTDEHAFAALDEGKTRDILGQYIQFRQQIELSGNFVASNRLHPTSTATCVRVRDGKRLVTDGPFAETREQLGGYFLVEAKNRDEAIDIAGRIPGARHGTIEVRQILEIPGLPPS
jgi:hypothetical protein